MNILRERALKAYYETPNYCLNCGEIIEIVNKQQPAEARRKKFCSHSCAATYNNKLRYENVIPKSKKSKTCPICGEAKFPDSNICALCYSALVIEKMLNSSIDKYFLKGNARIKYGAIRKWARKLAKIYGFKEECYICGYNKHTHVCHIKPVSSFMPNALMREVNHPNNLVLLCPNHHWELDNGLLKIQSSGRLKE